MCWSTPCGAPNRRTPSPTRCRHSWRGCAGRSAPTSSTPFRAATGWPSTRRTSTRSGSSRSSPRPAASTPRRPARCSSRRRRCGAARRWRTSAACRSAKRPPPGSTSCARRPSNCPPRPRCSSANPARSSTPCGALLAAEPLRESAAAVLARCLHAARAAGRGAGRARPHPRAARRRARCRSRSGAGRRRLAVLRGCARSRAVHPPRSRASWAARRTSAGSSACSRRTGW